MSPAPSAGEMPVAIHLHTGSRVLEIEWPDATRVMLTHAALRRHCKCAGCEHLRRSSQTAVPRDDIAIIEVSAVGAAALRLHFSDGHDRGIFPFAYLRQLGEMGLKTPCA